MSILPFVVGSAIVVGLFLLFGMFHLSRYTVEWLMGISFRWRVVAFILLGAVTVYVVGKIVMTA